MRFQVSSRIALAVSSVLLLASGASRAADILEEVVITAQRIREQLAAERALTPGGITVIDGDDLYERSVTNMTDMLRYVPGLWVESGWGSDELFFSSRGSNLDATDYDKNGVKMFQDGLPITTADGNNHNRVLDPLSARYAVIARGANALTYGASTLGGAFDFISPTARTTDPLSVYLSGGSNGLLSGRVTAGGVADSVDGLVTLEAKEYDGYRDHSRQERKGVYANAGWQVSDALSIRVYGTYLDNNEELPRGLSRAQFAQDPDQVVASAITGDNRKDVQTARAAFKTTWNIDADSSLEFGASYEEQSLYHPIVDIRGPDPDGAGPLLGPQFFSLLIDTDHETRAGMVRYKLEASDHDVVLGVNYGVTDVEGSNYQNLFGQRGFFMFPSDEHSENVEVYAIDRWALTDSWTLVYGAQFADTSRDVSGTRGDYSSFNPRLGVIYALNDSSELFVSVSKLFEPPTSFELADDTTGTGQLLDPMKGVVGEVGIRGSTGSQAATRWHWDVSAYYAAIDDEILSIDDPDAPGTSLSANVDSTIHAGIEALLGASFALRGEAHRLEPLVSLTINRFSFDSDARYGDDDLPAAPKYAVRGELMYRHAGGIYAGPTFDLVGKRYADFTNTYQVSSYELLGLRGGFSTEHWEVFAELRNLLDKDYVAMLNVRDSADATAEVLFPGAPRSAYVGARFAF
ncbi:MAG: TonB-dependent receptor [Pseudomonadota bacterium]|nr:TonB-dependent receptor [Pseudomonadota bacterium]